MTSATTPSHSIVGHESPAALAAAATSRHKAAPPAVSAHVLGVDVDFCVEWRMTHRWRESRWPVGECGRHRVAECF